MGGHSHAIDQGATSTRAVVFDERATAPARMELRRVDGGRAASDGPTPFLADIVETSVDRPACPEAPSPGAVAGTLHHRGTAA